jgi:GNAT superfamily N-acetyltransferase
MKAMEIREAHLGDVPALVALDAVARSSPERARVIQDAVGNGECLVAARDQVVGYLVLKHSFFGNGFIELLYVREDTRRQGVGGALMRAAEARCRTSKLFTSTNESNLPMRALLGALGYQESGIIHNLDPSDPEIVYVRFPVGWSLWRQDDHGNRFEVNRDHTREDAERLKDEFEARGHKQIYWIEPTRS